MRNDSSGGVGAKMASYPAMRISRATRRLRYFGFSSSPLLTSTHLTLMGGRPVNLQASLMAKTPDTLRSEIVEFGLPSNTAQVWVQRLSSDVVDEPLVAIDYT